MYTYESIRIEEINKVTITHDCIFVFDYFLTWWYWSIIILTLIQYFCRIYHAQAFSGEERFLNFLEVSLYEGFFSYLSHLSIPNELLSFLVEDRFLDLEVLRYQ